MRSLIRLFAEGTVIESEFTLTLPSHIHKVKAILISSGSGCKRVQPPYSALEYESREWIQKPAGIVYDTTGEFVTCGGLALKTSKLQAEGMKRNC